MSRRQLLEIYLGKLQVRANRYAISSYGPMREVMELYR